MLGLRHTYTIKTWDDKKCTLVYKFVYNYTEITVYNNTNDDTANMIYIYIVSKQLKLIFAEDDKEIKKSKKVKVQLELFKRCILHSFWKSRHRFGNTLEILGIPETESRFSTYRWWT